VPKARERIAAVQKKRWALAKAKQVEPEPVKPKRTMSCWSPAYCGGSEEAMGCAQGEEDGCLKNLRHFKRPVGDGCDAHPHGHVAQRASNNNSVV
jgi:hypothetical protein